MMSARETFNAAMSFDLGAPTLKAEFGYWTTTVKRFLREGMPETCPLPPGLSDNGTLSGADAVDPSGSAVTDVNVRAACGLQSHAAKFPCDYSPQLPVRILDENEEYRTLVDSYGITNKERKTGATPPLDLDFPVKTRADFEAYRERYVGSLTSRLPGDWEALARRLSAREFPIRLGGVPYGFLGLPRHLMGTEGLFLAMYDDPQFVKDINAFFLGFVEDYWAPIITAIRPDCVMIWEDMAYSNGPMIGVDAFREFLLPGYRSLVGFLREMGVANIHVDSDGFIQDLIPLWVEAGVTGVFPLERKAGNDLRKIRERFPRLQLLGGIDKRILTAQSTEEDIDRELAIAADLIAQGGFIPHVDHHVSEDACWRNFRYYRQKLNRMIDAAASVR